MGENYSEKLSWLQSTTNRTKQIQPEKKFAASLIAFGVHGLNTLKYGFGVELLRVRVFASGVNA